MDILELAEKYTTLKRESATLWAGPCPGCGGNDRFYVRTDSQTWACRFCAPDESGQERRDDILFCRHYLEMSFQDACRATGNHDKLTGPVSGAVRQLPQREKRQPTIAADHRYDPAVWASQAQRFAAWAHQNLMQRPDLLDWLERERGIQRFTVEAWGLGFNPSFKPSKAELWGFSKGQPACSKHSEPVSDCGSCGKVWLQPGLVIPHRQPTGEITGLKMRLFRPDDQAPPDVTPDQELPRRYANVKGGGGRPWTLSQPFTGPVAVVESELDALLLWQDLDLMIQVVALLSASVRPQTIPAGPVLYACDFDEAGKKHYAWWRDKYQARPCPPVAGKDIGDMVKEGVPLREWLRFNLQEEQLLTPMHLNPYAHFSLVAGEAWDLQGQIPDHLWRACRAVKGPVVRWQQRCDDPAARAACEDEYRRLWGIERLVA